MLSLLVSVSSNPYYFFIPLRDNYVVVLGIYPFFVNWLAQYLMGIFPFLSHP